tara:strand:+ start:5131 stop:5460 length:330 start_codon:yes stop_codon:yes gene_type:complete
MTTETNKLREKIMNVAVSILTAGLIGAFTFAWNLNAEIAIIKNTIITDSNSKETADEVLKDWSKEVRNIEALQSQMKSMWKNVNMAQEKELKWEHRISKIEAKQDICCH